MIIFSKSMIIMASLFSCKAISQLFNPISEVSVFGRLMFIKRDDFLSLNKNMIDITGNKARKLYSLAQKEVTPDYVISSGGIQSNAMRALAKLCEFRRMQLIYFTKSIPKALSGNPNGNLKESLACGMKLETATDSDYNRLSTAMTFDEISDLPCIQALGEVKKANTADVLYVPMGASGALAEEGVSLLCKEILEFILTKPQDKPWKILFAAGTGTTAYYASKYFRKEYLDIEVIAIPCVGDDVYLKHLLLRLADYDVKNIFEGRYNTPTVLASNKKRAFAGLYPYHYTIWSKLCFSTGIDFDLLYAPRVFDVLLQHSGVKEEDGEEKIEKGLKNLYNGCNILYYHCGGLEANESQLARYRFKKIGGLK